MTAPEHCRYFLRGNTRVFSQDPTVCRYIVRRFPTEEKPYDDQVCQRSTHEQPPDNIVSETVSANQ
jgi:hypothetical protein